MITIKKLRTLKAGTLRRKTAVLLQAFENDLIEGRTIDIVYLKQLIGITAEAFPGTKAETSAGELGALLDLGADGQQTVFALSSLRHAVLAELGAEPADWDLSRSRSAVLSESMKPGRKFELYLDDIRSPFNLGSIFRTAEAFGVSKIMLSPDCPPPSHRRARRSSMGCTELVPWERVPKEDVFSGGAGYQNIFALELGGTGIGDFRFPKEGLAVIGSEELGISPAAKAAAGKGLGLVSIPITGLKGSINVSVAFGIMMQRWSEV